MAVICDGSSTFLSSNGAITLGGTIRALGCYFNSINSSNDQVLLRIDHASLTGVLELVYRGSTGKVRFTVTGSLGSTSIDSTATVSTGTWAYVLGTYDGTSNSTVSVNNETPVNGAPLVGTVNSNRVKVGAESASTRHLDGRIAEPFILSAAPTTSQRASLYGGGIGRSPLSVMPGSTLHYWRLLRGEGLDVGSSVYYFAPYRGYFGLLQESSGTAPTYYDHPRFVHDSRLR